MRLVHSTKLRERGGQPEICLRIISVSLERLSKPRNRLLVAAEVELRQARVGHPLASQRIARTEAQGLRNASLGFLGVTDINLAESENSMGGGKISIERQRMFTFGDALRAAPGEYLDKSQVQMRPRVVWDRRQGFGQLRFGGGEGRHRFCQEQGRAIDRVRAPRSNKRLDIVGIGGERAIEKAACLRHIVRGITLIEQSQTLKIEVHRVGGRSLFGASRLGGDELGVQRARQARDDVVLHVEEIGQGLVKPLGPEMIAGFGVDELDVDAHAGAAALDAALEDIADVQLTPDRLYLDRFALVGERRVSGDHE